MNSPLRKYELHSIAFGTQDVNKKYHTNKPPTFFITDKSPEREYRGGVFKSSLHSGQQKLCLAEIKFLCDYLASMKKSDIEKLTILYVGAASYRHGYLLITKLFPGLKWILIDPGKFDPSIMKLSKEKNSNVIVDNSFFDNKYAKKIAKKYKSKSIIFISDIRLEASEENIMKDMEYQKIWLTIMKNVTSLAFFKFRLPWEKIKDHEYLDGKVQLQQYAPRTSTETRLIIDLRKDNKIKIRKWDTSKYENQMFYFNTVTRLRYYNWLEQNYENVVKDNKGMDHCHDCASMVMICENYIQKYPDNPYTLHDNIKDNINDMVKDVIKYSLAKNTNMLISYAYKSIKRPYKLDRELTMIQKVMDSVQNDKNNKKRVLDSQMSKIKKLKDIIKKFNSLYYDNNNNNKRKSRKEYYRYNKN